MMGAPGKIPRDAVSQGIAHGSNRAAYSRPTSVIKAFAPRESEAFQDLFIDRTGSHSFDVIRSMGKRERFRISKGLSFKSEVLMIFSERR